MHNMYCIACMMNMMYMTSVLYEYEEYEYGYCEGIVKGWPRQPSLGEVTITSPNDGDDGDDGDDMSMGILKVL